MLSQLDRAMIDRTLRLNVEAIRILHHEPRDIVDKAVNCFVVRLANSWRSLAALWEHVPETALVDCGALLRAMYEARIQAAYVLQDSSKRLDRASDYFDYRVVERYLWSQSLLKQQSALGERMRKSPRRAEGEPKLLAAYQKVKSKFAVHPGKPDKMRDKWYVGSLRDIARAVGEEHGYDVFIKNFNGSVHSSALALTEGPCVDMTHTQMQGAGLLGKTQRLALRDRGKRLLDESEGILDVLNGDPIEEMGKLPHKSGSKP